MCFSKNVSLKMPICHSLKLSYFESLLKGLFQLYMLPSLAVSKVLLWPVSFEE